MLCGVFLSVFPQILRLDLKSKQPHYTILIETHLKISPTFSKIKIAKKFLLSRYSQQMALQFPIEGRPRSLVSLSYASSDEDMEVDSVTSVQDHLDKKEEDDEIQVLACYYENPPFLPQLAAGRAMTTSLTQSLNDLNLPADSLLETIDTFTEPSDDLINWAVGHPPATYCAQDSTHHPIAECSQLDPVIQSPASPPLADQMPYYHYEHQQQHDQRADQWVQNRHITGLAISVSSYCGQPNDTSHSGCIVCGKSYPEIKEEITLGYLEGSHVSGESYDQRMARRRAFQAGMRAGSFILIPLGVSQAAACDGLLYQVMPEDFQINPAPGVLPL